MPPSPIITTRTYNFPGNDISKMAAELRNNLTELLFNGEPGASYSEWWEKPCRCTISIQRMDSTVIASGALTMAKIGHYRPRPGANIPPQANMKITLLFVPGIRMGRIVSSMNTSQLTLVWPSMQEDPPVYKNLLMDIVPTQIPTNFTVVIKYKTPPRPTRTLTNDAALELGQHQRRRTVRRSS